MLRAIPQDLLHLLGRARDQTHMISVITAFGAPCRKQSLLSLRRPFAIAPRLCVSRGERRRVCTQCELLRASEALRLGSSISASSTEPWHATCGGLQRKCMRGAFAILSFLSQSLPLVLAPSRSNRLRSCASRKTSGTSTAIIVAIRPERGGRLFPPKDGCTVALSRIFAGKVARRRPSHYSRRRNQTGLRSSIRDEVARY